MKPQSHRIARCFEHWGWSLWLALFLLAMPGCMVKKASKANSGQSSTRRIARTKAAKKESARVRNRFHRIALKKKPMPRKAAKRGRRGMEPPAPPAGNIASDDANTITDQSGRGGSGKGKKKSDGKDKNKAKQKAQVWQRTAKGTVLSKVSVGGNKTLQLKKLRVTVQVEGLRVRTIMDHIYYNPHGRTLQGTFKYTLPPESSVSYYAMFVGRQNRRPRFFVRKGVNRRLLVRSLPSKVARLTPKAVWGTLREARLVAAEKGREVFENITRRRIDPALLEQDAPNTFSGRVFPIQAKGYNRIILAYEQTLPEFRSQRVYRFRFPPEVADSIDFSLGYNGKLSSLRRHNLRKIRCLSKPSRSFVRCLWEQNKPDRDAIFYFAPSQKEVSAVAGQDPTTGARYLYGQLRVNLPTISKGNAASNALFLLDTSLSENPDHFAANVTLLQKILKNNAGIKRFNILFFDVHAQWLNKGWMPNNDASRKTLQAKLNKLLLEGATNLSGAFEKLAKPAWLKERKQNADVFLLSDASLSWGTREPELFLQRFAKNSRWGQLRFFAYQTGLGSENLPVLRRLTRDGGAVFPCLGRSELERCSTAHTKASLWLQSFAVQGVGASETLVAARQATFFPGSLLTFGSRFARNGKATLVLKGQFQGKPWSRKLTLNVSFTGELAPRAWAELAIAQLSAMNDPKLSKLIVAYSQHFRIPNEHCSFLVLETDKEYKQYGLEKQRKEKKVKDIADFLNKLLKERGKGVTPQQRWEALFRKGLKRGKMLGKSNGRAVLSLFRLSPESHFLFAGMDADRLWTKQEVDRGYLKTRLRSKTAFAPFVREAKRRLEKKMLSGAIRSLSSIVELHPSNPKALRLVGYYLMSWKQPNAAAFAFLRVLERRSYEPHAWRDLARSLQKLGRYGLAAAMYEVILGNQWHSRFGSIHTIAREEYSLLIQEAMNSKTTPPALRAQLRKRKALMGLVVRPSKLRVTVTWNTDNTDIDLWVTEPNGSKCWYRKKKTPNGGRLLEDITRGYGPERYENKGGLGGEYKIQMQYYGHRSNTFGNETHVSVQIVINAGSKEQKLIEKNLVLRKRKQVVDIAKLNLGGRKASWWR
jgi:hypothetical protein